MISFSRKYHALNSAAWFWYTLAENIPSKQSKGDGYA
jgi:hypothetical protein